MVDPRRPRCVGDSSCPISIGRGTSPPSASVSQPLNAGYEPTEPAEIAPGPCSWVSDTDARRIGLLGNLSVHEAHDSVADNLVREDGEPPPPRERQSCSPRAWQGGSRCTGDFATADHLVLADVPLGEVRQEFGVPPWPGVGN